MKISVITVTYNSAASVVDTLRSVEEQTYPDIEHIIVDGDSTDNTCALVTAHGKRVARLISEPDNGIYDAMNKGLNLATGEIVGFLNSDDIYAHKDVLSEYAQVFQNHNVDACYGDLVYVSKNDVSKVVRYWQSRPYQRGLCAQGWMPAHPTFYVRRALYRQWGGFDTELKLQADFEMALRLLEVYEIQSYYLPQIVVRMRTGGVSNKSLGNIIQGNIEAIAACRKHNFPSGIGFVTQKLFSRIPQFFKRPSEA